jgi:hypothetical protein
MRLDHNTRVRVALSAVVVWLDPLTPNAWAQADSAPLVSSLPLAQTSAVGWFSDGVAEILLSEGIVLVVCVLWCGLLVAGMEAFDLWRERREEWGTHLCTHIATLLQHDRTLRRLRVTPIVHLPLWGRSQATIELRGGVPTLSLRRAVLRAAEGAAAANGVAFRILDRIAIVRPGKALTV